jgi:hypothetical protein
MLQRKCKKKVKKMQKYLVMSKICSTFALAFAQKTGVTQKGASKNYL